MAHKTKHSAARASGHSMFSLPTVKTEPIHSCVFRFVNITSGSTTFNIFMKDLLYMIGVTSAYSANRNNGLPIAQSVRLEMVRVYGVSTAPGTPTTISLEWEGYSAYSGSGPATGYAALGGLSQTITKTGSGLEPACITSRPPKDCAVYHKWYTLAGATSAPGPDVRAFNATMNQKDIIDVHVSFILCDGADSPRFVAPAGVSASTCVVGYIYFPYLDATQNGGGADLQPVTRTPW
jgi:hypothetical protein